MRCYYYIALAMLLSQVVFLLQILRNYRYALKQHKRQRNWYRPRTVLIVPCKGLERGFEKNITSFFNQEYENYLLWFVVEDTDDPAYSLLCKLKDKLAQNSKAQNVQILIAGKGLTCSQKVHNLLHCYEQITDEIEIMAFADSDVCLRDNWLSHIVYPLRQSKNGAAGGYRWFVPKKNNSATLALSAINAKIAQLLGNTRFNQVWGGSMAIRSDVFKRVGLDEIWQKALSDDLSLTRAVKKAGLRVAFVPACLVASYEITTWAKLFEFGRRQFLITRVFTPAIWVFGLFSSLYSVAGLWATAALAVYAVKTGDINTPLFVAVPIVFFASQLTRTILRQAMIGRLLKEDLPNLKAARLADIFFFWLWSLLLLGIIVYSAFGRTITWRQIRYKLLSPDQTIVLDP